MKARFLFGIAGLYFVLALLWTFPLITRASSHIYGVPGDSYGTISGFWWLTYARTHDLNPAKITLLNAPFGIDAASAPRQPLEEWIGFVLTYLFGPIRAYNILFLLSFALAGLGVFLLVHDVTQNKLASFFAGLLFAFSPYHLFQGYQHLSLAQIQWIPLYFFFLFRLLRTGAPYSVLLTGFFYAVLVLQNFYYGFFVTLISVPVIVAAVLATWWRARRMFISSSAIFKAGEVFGVSALLILPFIWRPLSIVLGLKGAPEQLQRTFTRGIEQLHLYRAGLSNYLLPHIDHPLWGEFSYHALAARLAGGNFFEKTLFLGYTPVLLTAVGLLVLLRKDKTSAYISKRVQLLLLFLIGCTAVLITSAPGIQRLLYQIAPAFRVYARAGIVLIMVVSLFAGLGLHWMLQRTMKKWALFLMVSIIVLTEFLNFPPAHLTRVDAKGLPVAYQWVAENVHDGILVEYPLVDGSEPVSSLYALGQTVHQKPIFNHAPLGSKEDELRKSLIDPTNPSVMDRLSLLGVRWVIIHKDLYRQGRIFPGTERYFDPSHPKYTPEFNFGLVPETQKNPRLALRYEDDATRVYEITLLQSPNPTP